MTNGLPPAQNPPNSRNQSAVAADLPEDPSQELLPLAQPEPAAATGLPVSWKADRQTWVGHVATLYGVTEFHFRDYTLSADKVTYDEQTSVLTAEGHLQLTGGPQDVVLTASHGDVRVNSHTARFYDVTGTMGLRSAGRTVVYSTPNPFIVHARVLLETGEGSYRVVDGSMTNCKLPRPDWQLLARSIRVADGYASTHSTYFKFLGVPIFYLPYFRHPINEAGRQSGFLIPNLSNSSIRGYTFGEQVYLVLSRNMDMVVGTEYYSKSGWAPNGDFRYRGPGTDHLDARWSALLDRGFSQLQTSGPLAGQSLFINQGGTDIAAVGHKNITPETRIAGDIEYLSRYIYRLVFNDNYWQAVSSEVKSDVSLTHAHNGLVPSLDISRLQSFASPKSGDEVRILRLPSLRYDVLDRPIGTSSAYWGLGASMSHLGRSEPGFHAHNEGRFDLYPHISFPMVAAGWSMVPEGALRATFYSGSQTPDLTGDRSGIPSVSHDPLHRISGEASVDLRPPVLARDFSVRGWRLRHVIEPELNWRLAGGIGSKERNVLLVDTSDIVTDTHEVGFSLAQRLYLRPRDNQPCPDSEDADCVSRPREWASWVIAQRYYLDPNFGGALIRGRRNVFSDTLSLTGIAFLTEPRNLSPLVSRMRFNAIHNVGFQWDLDYDPRAGRIAADNIFAGYTRGVATIGIGHSLLNAVDEQGSAASLIQSQQVQPFLQIGKPNAVGFNLAANGGYDFVHGALQYGGVQGVYNWNCCGLTVGYRRFALGDLRDETQYLYSFTLANFGSVGDIRRSNSVFRDPNAPPAF